MNGCGLCALGSEQKAHRLKKERTPMSKKKRRGKLNWRSKKANHGAKPGRG